MSAVENRAEDRRILESPNPRWLEDAKNNIRELQLKKWKQ
jgi:hypothetical protein